MKKINQIIENNASPYAHMKDEDVPLWVLAERQTAKLLDLNGRVQRAESRVKKLLVNEREAREATALIVLVAENAGPPAAIGQCPVCDHHPHKDWCWFTAVVLWARAHHPTPLKGWAAWDSYRGLHL